MAQRIALGVVAVLVLVFLAVDLRQAQLQAEGLNFDKARSSFANTADALDKLDRAAELTPGTEPDVGRAALLIFSGRQRDAIPVLQEVVRREPENVNAWGLLAEAQNETDPGSETVAARKVVELDPQRRR